MIHVTIFENDHEECIGFQTEGHAEYSEAGQDIVCAAVSMLVINTINAIDLYTDDEASLISDEESGMISWNLKQRPSAGTELLLNTMILGLRQMADDDNYAEYIQLNFEEV